MSIEYVICIDVVITSLVEKQVAEYIIRCVSQFS